MAAGKKEKARIQEIISRLDGHYGTGLKTYLEHEKPYELLFSTIMSAQCTDDRVNLVGKTLYKKYPTLESFAGASLKELEEDIRSTGFYHNKAKNIIASANMLINEYGGEVPSDIELLTRLPGVGRKTANVIRGNIFGIDSIVVDTHVGRVSRKLGLTKEEDPVKVEFELYKVLPKDHWILWNLQIIAHGRAVCTARSPKCEGCFLKDLCPSAGKK